MRGCKRRSNQIARHRRRATSLKDKRYAKLAGSAPKNQRVGLVTIRLRLAPPNSKKEEGGDSVQLPKRLPHLQLLSSLLKAGQDSIV